MFGVIFYILLGLVMEFIGGVVPVFLIYLYALERDRQTSEHLVYALGAWTAFFCLVALVLRMPPLVLVPVGYWGIWTWTSVTKRVA